MGLLQNNQPEPFSITSMFTYKIPILSKILIVEFVLPLFTKYFIEIDLQFFTEN